MRLNITIKVNCGSGLLLTVKKGLFATRESVMEIIQTALRGDTDIANIIGSIAQHMSYLPELGDVIVPDLDLEVYVNLSMQSLDIRYAAHQTYAWRICSPDIPRFLEIRGGDIWRFIEHMSYTLNADGAVRIPMSNRVAYVSGSGRNDPPPSRA